MGRKPNEKPEEVLRVAAKLFESRGYQGTSMDDVAAGVGLNKGTIYHYFPSKSAILFEIYTRTQDLILESLDEIPEDAELEEGLAILIRAQLEIVARHRNQAVVYFQEMRWIGEWLEPKQVKEIRRRERLFTDFVTALVERGADPGRFSPTDAKIAAFGLIGMSAWTYQWFEPKGRLSPDAITDILVSVMMHGLRGDGRELAAAPGAGRRRAAPS